jgi:zeta toxin
MAKRATAASTGPIRAPTTRADIARFLKAVDNHFDVQEIVIRTTGYQAEVTARGGKTVMQWSNLRHAGHPAAIRTRTRLHEGILDNLLRPDSRAPAGTPPIATIIIGPPGAGKTSIVVPLARSRLGVEFSSVNPDDVKELLPEYEGWNAPALHEESADVAELRIEPQALNRRYNIIYDVTGRSARKVEGAIERFQAYGYRVYLLFADLPAWKAAWRSWDRFQVNPFGSDPALPPGRFVPPRYVYEYVGDRPGKTFDSLKESRLLSGSCRWDVDVPIGRPPRIVYRKSW